MYLLKSVSSVREKLCFKNPPHSQAQLGNVEFWLAKLLARLAEQASRSGGLSKKPAEGGLGEVIHVLFTISIYYDGDGYQLKKTISKLPFSRSGHLWFAVSAVL